MEKEEKYTPLELKSDTLQRFFFRLDDIIYAMEERIISLQQQLEESEKRYFNEMHNQLLAGQKMQADILIATLGVPKPETVGPVGAIVLANIMSMEPNEKIKEYIKSIANKKEEEVPC